MPHKTLKDFHVDPTKHEAYSLINKGEYNHVKELKSYFDIPASEAIETKLVSDHLKLSFLGGSWEQDMIDVARNLEFKLDPGTQTFLTAQPKSGEAEHFGSFRVVQWNIFAHDREVAGEQQRYFQDVIVLMKDNMAYSGSWPWIRKPA